MAATVAGVCEKQNGPHTPIRESRFTSVVLKDAAQLPNFGHDCNWK